jgi:hypothetical protein
MKDGARHAGCSLRYLYDLEATAENDCGPQPDEKLWPDLWTTKSKSA